MSFTTLSNQEIIPNKQQPNLNVPREQYNSWAKSYDEETSSFQWSAPQFLLEAVVRQVAPVGHLRVLDVGVGTALASVPYLEAGARVTGLDISDRMLHQARSKYPQFHALIEHDFNQPITNIGLQTSSFDIIISCGALHFARDLNQTLTQLKSLLAPGGLFAFTYIPIQQRKFSTATQPREPNAVEQILRNLDLTVINHEEFVAYYQAANPNDPVIYQRILARCNKQAISLPSALQNIDRTACVDRERLISTVNQPLMQGVLSTQWTSDITSIKTANQHLVNTLLHQLNNGELQPKQLPLPNITAKLTTSSALCDVLVLMPHPDDESIYAGGTIAALTNAGKRIRLVVATDGAAGRGGDNLTVRRAGELQRAAEILNIERVESLGFRDFGKYRDTARTQPITAADTLRTWGLDSTLAAIVRSIREHRPQVILTLHPEVDANYSLHGHHLGLGIATLVAYHLAADPSYILPENLLPWAVEEHHVIIPEYSQGLEIIRVEIDCERKLQALEAYTTQHYSTQRLIKALQTIKSGANFETMQILQARCRKPHLTLTPLSPQHQITESANAKNWQSIYSKISQQNYPRHALANLLQQQAEIWGTSSEILTNIEKLRQAETVAVVTGQQVGLFGGPAYTLYKALGAVQLAYQLQSQGIPAVPIFWMASYDHDIEEVQQVKLLANQAKTLSLGIDPQKYPVGSLKLGLGIYSLLDKIESHLVQLPYGEEIIAELRDIYRPDTTFTEAFACWLNSLTKKLGLVILNPAVSEFAYLASHIYERELFANESSGVALERTRQDLKSQGISETISTERDFLQIFYTGEDGIRRRLRRVKGGFALQQSNIYLTDEITRNLLKTHPERFSPSALLRPIIQDAVLPTIAYVAGPTEQQYFKQLPEVYTWAEIIMPRIVARPSFTIIDRATSNKLAPAGGLISLLNSDNPYKTLGETSLPESVGIQYDELTILLSRSFDLRKSALAGKFVGNAAITLQQDIEKWLYQTKLSLETWGETRPLKASARLQSELPQLLAKITTDLQRSGNPSGPPPTRNLVILARELARFQRTLIRQGRRQNIDSVTAFTSLNPNGTPQERHLNTAELIATQGFSIVEQLLPISQPNSKIQTHLITIN